MNISEEDAELFFRLMFSLQFFVNQRLGILPQIDTLEKYIDSSLEEKFQVREALYENIHLIESFIDENPQNFPMKELTTVSKWKHFVKGDFFVERFLKNHSVFVSDENKVYGVLGLNNSLEEVIPREALPLRIKTVLLHFRDKIVYDGLLQPYNVFFGGGISSELKEIYLAAKQNGEIITSLETGAKTSGKKAAKPLKDWKPEIEKLIAKAVKLRGGNGQPTLYSPAFSLVKASLEFAHLAVSAPNEVEKLFKSLEKLDRELSKAEQTIYRIKRY